MVSSLDKRYIALFESILEVLLVDSDISMEHLLKPLRIYINDINRFSTPKIFTSKFRAFIKTRDEHLVDTVIASDSGHQEKESASLHGKEEINQILDKVLNLLEKGLHSSKDISVDFQEIIQQIQKAKTINNVKRLSEAFVEAGNKIVSKNQDFQADLSKLAVELSFCKNQIEDLENQLESTRQEAENDHLTSLRNRRVFDSDLSDAVQRAKRFESPLCLLLLDLDYFKEINDRWGHQVGDDVLVNFAKLLSKSLDEYDLTYRLGGDEFAILFIGTSFAKAKEVALELRSFVTNKVYRINELSFSMTLSGGLAQLRETENQHTFFDRTDKRLYAAKNAGRDRICFEDSPIIETNLEAPLEH